MKRQGNLAFFIPHLGCPHQCSFCNQLQISGEGRAPSLEEVRDTCQRVLEQAPMPLEIAFFGGSFTAIPISQMEAYLQVAAPFVEKGLATGIRLSTRPDAIDDIRLGLLKSYGVTAVELGAQSMDDRVLRRNGRGHTAQQVRDASRAIRASGFSLGLQMMIGLPGGDSPMEDANHTVSEFLVLQPDTVRIYPTLVLPHTPLAQWWQEGTYRPLEVEEAVAICAKALPRFEDAGVQVIRIGLQEEESLQQGVLAGPHHPAFGELVRSRVWRNDLEEQLQGQLRGQGNANIHYFEQQSITLCIQPVEGLERVRIDKE